VCLADWSMKDERVVDKLRSSEPSCVRHHLGRINALTYRRDGMRTSRGRPYCYADCDHSDGNRTQTDRAHPKSSPCSNKLLVRYQTLAPTYVMGITLWLKDLGGHWLKDLGGQSQSGGLWEIVRVRQSWGERGPPPPTEMASPGALPPPFAPLWRER